MLQRFIHLSGWMAVLLSGSLMLVCAAEESVLPSLPSDYPSGLNAPGVFKHANDFYLNNEPEKACDGYNYLYDLGLRNGYLFYNLGNTHFRLGNLGESILWYERALEYLPRFSDLRINYESALGLLADEEFRAPEYGGTLGFLMGLHERINLSECLWITVILLWILAGLFVMRMMIPNHHRGAWLSIPCWIVGVAFILSCLSSAVKVYQYETITEAVVMASAVEVKTAPGDDFSTTFSLHEGTKVQLVQNEEGWVRIVLPGNRSFTGWIPQSAVEAI